jgi:nucleoside-diphosphate-sugar epimerase
MLIAVTGGSGYVGTAVVEELLRAGHAVRVLDLEPPRVGGVEHVPADILEPGALAGGLAGCDRVIHLAAVPAPDRASDRDTLETNVMGTFNVFEAAADAGIGYLVWASSEAVLGVPFELNAPECVPIDEGHPCRPESAYALSKVMGEEIARFFARCRGVDSVGLRFAIVTHPKEYADFPRDWDDARGRAWNLWAYVDVRDAATACRQAVEVACGGARTAIVTAADTVMDRENAELLDEAFPSVARVGPVDGHATLLLHDVASELFGFKPRHSWRDAE